MNKVLHRLQHCARTFNPDPVGSFQHMLLVGWWICIDQRVLLGVLGSVRDENFLRYSFSFRFFRSDELQLLLLLGF